MDSTGLAVRAPFPELPSLRKMFVDMIEEYARHAGHADLIRESIDGAGRRGPAGVSITVAPANEASWDDLRTVLGTRGAAAGCQCQRFKLARRESFGSFPVEERAHRLRQQTDAGHPEAETTSGLVAYADGEPAGWCAVEPRPAFTGLVRNNRVPWEGRDEDRSDDSVWAVTCVYARKGFRRQGVSRALVGAAVDFARDRGARALEAYPMNTTDVIVDELLRRDRSRLRRRRLRRGEPADAATRRDADRLLTLVGRTVRCQTSPGAKGAKGAKGAAWHWRRSTGRRTRPTCSASGAATAPASSG